MVEELGAFDLNWAPSVFPITVETANLIGSAAGSILV